MGIMDLQATREQLVSNHVSSARGVIGITRGRIVTGTRRLASTVVNQGIEPRNAGLKAVMLHQIEEVSVGMLRLKEELRDLPRHLVLLARGIATSSRTEEVFARVLNLVLEGQQGHLVLRHQHQ
jgi:hypothetical protein